MSGLEARRAAATVVLPTFHPGQVRAYLLGKGKPAGWARYKVIRCGRRWGKSALLASIATDLAVKGQPVGYFAPDYKRLAEIYNDVVRMLTPVLPRGRGNKIEGVIRTTTGGRIDFWTLNDENAGRSRFYKKVLIDEGAFTDPNMMDIWERAIEPTLFDLSGSCTVASNTNGVADDNFFYQICPQQGEEVSKHGFVEYHAPTWDNPLLPRRLTGEEEHVWQARREAEFVKLKEKKHPLVFAQEHEASFIDWSGVAFFAREKLLLDNAPVDYPTRCDALFAICDSATKTGKEHDGTGVLYCALINHGKSYKLVLLDYDLVQIEGAMLEEWIPGHVFKRLRELAAIVKPRVELGVFLEDKNSGSVLLQHAAKRGWTMSAVPSGLTAIGKSERAISVSSYVHQGLVKFSKYVWEKSTQYKDHTRNQLTKQVFGFRIGQKDDEDDLLDTFTYAIAIGLGDGGGW